jgi:CRISPR/Cas system-associated protein Cas10 (large subunit of type III CRISPR-Cas system)
MLYAGADELLVFSPAEDAFDIACAIHASFTANRAIHASFAENCATAQALGHAKIADVTISASVLYAHIRAPLRWAIAESAMLPTR